MRTEVQRSHGTSVLSTPSKTNVTRLLFLLTSGIAIAQPSLTVYNQNFAIIRQVVPLDLKPGTNKVTHRGVTSLVEPESVTLRDPTGKVLLRVLEQSYRSDPISMEALLRDYEGRVVEFEIRMGDQLSVVPGKIVRAGSPAPQPPFNPYVARPPEM